MSGLWDLLRANADRRIALLASGDPLFFGIGSTLLRHLPPEHLLFHPNVSSIQAAFARLGRPWQQAQWVSLHGRPLASLRAVLQGNRLYALLTDRDSSPTAIARILSGNRLRRISDLWVAEEPGRGERTVSFHSAPVDLADADTEFSPLNVVILETAGRAACCRNFPAFPTSGSAPARNRARDC
jgi:precorrin-6Y C5,15-methyltransferase (decarboxylating)